MSAQSNAPSWIIPEIFKDALRESVPGFKDIKSFKICDALPPGENYVATVLKVEISVCCMDKSVTTQNFFLKVPLNSDLYNNMLYKWNMFPKEQETYRVLIPDFEQMYRDVGVEVNFGPKTYDLPVKHEYLLMEDLSKRGFKNANRQNGLDKNHCQSVLKKLAQWHAASATRVERKGPYDPIYLVGSINPEGEALVRSMMSSAIQNILKVSKDLKGSHVYYEQLQKLEKHFTEFLLAHIDHNPDEFNVLNHGDFWCNNIMFNYDEEENLKETYLIDFQLLRYGSPGHDLVYFLLTSAQLQLKVTHFEELIKYYHNHLIENLKLLQYSKSLPSLGDLHKMIAEARAWSTFAGFSIMPAALADPVESATLDNLVGDSAESIKQKEQILRQERIMKHLEIVLPWMYFKGHFEFK